MRTRTTALALCPAILLLAACGNYEDASAEAQADTVEIPANEPLANVTAAPVADPNANTDVAGDELIDAEGEDVTADGAAAGDTAEGTNATPAATPTASPTPSAAE